jgi:hypothetical protein
MSKKKDYEDTVEYRAPARSASPASDVLVPFLQSAITGAVFGLVVGVPSESLRTGAIAFAVVFCLSWTVLLFDHRRLLWAIERVVDQDIDRDERIGKPEPPGTVVIDGRRVGDARAAERKRADILRFVNVVWSLQQANRPFGQKALRGRHLIHQDVTDEFHAEVGAKLVAAGFAERSGTGWRLTATPDEVENALTTW